VFVSADVIFRIAFSILWLIFFAGAARARHLAGVSIGRRVGGTAGWSQIVAVALAVAYFAGALLYATVPAVLAPLLIPLPGWFRLIMICVGAVGVSFAVWGLQVLGKNWAPSMTGLRNDTELVTTGPYGIVRNPIYLGALLFLPSLALVADNWLMFLPAIALCIMLHTYVDQEEATLIAHFGDAYLDYMRRTPKLVPKLRRSKPNRN